MASITPDSTTKIILADSSKWEDWNERFIAKAISYKLWNYVEDKTTLIQEPAKPHYKDFDTKPPVRNTRSTQPQDSTNRTPENELPPQVSFSDLTVAEPRNQSGNGI